jgi:hypothetical protein
VRGVARRASRHADCIILARNQTLVQHEEHFMQSQQPKRDGKIKYGLAAWLLGLPLPIVIIALFFRGCDW